MPWPGYGFALDGGRCWIRPPHGEDPNGKRVVVSGYTNHESSLIRLDASPHVIIDGLAFEGAGDKAVKANRNSPYLTLRNAVIEYCRHGVGPDDHALVEWCEYRFPGYKRFADDIKKVMLENRIFVTNPMFGFVKRYHSAHTEGHLIGRPWTAPRNNRGVGPLYGEARYNFCYETFDGDAPGAWSEASVHSSVYVYTYDNAIELEAGPSSEARNVKVHDNLIIASVYGAISHQDTTTEPMGPQWVYRNVVVGNYPEGYAGPDKLMYHEVDSADDSWSPWILSKFLAPNADPIAYDHNFFWLKGAGLLWAKPETAASRAKMPWRNNVIVFEEEGLTNYKDPYRFRAAANAWVAPGPRPDIQGRGGMHFRSITELGLVDPANLDFRPAEGSPLIDAGVKIPGPSGFDATDGAPDIGPFQAASDTGPLPGMEWPRPRTRVFNAAPPERLTGQPEPIRLITP